jgi:hypothetical protein
MLSRRLSLLVRESGTSADEDSLSNRSSKADGLLAQAGSGMGRNEETRAKVDQFIMDEIDSVPHLEALLLVWNRRPKQWSTEQMARELYVQPDRAAKILQDLVNRSLIGTNQDASPAFFFYQSKSSERDDLLDALDRIYRAEVVRVSTMIHAKASPAVRDFARAFRFTKERE